MTLPRLMMGGAGRFQLKYRDSRALGSGGQNRTITNVQLGPESPDRKIYVIAALRTNSTTTDRRISVLDIKVGTTTYTGTQIVGPSANEGSPIAIWQISVPTGTVGEIHRTIPGSGTHSAGENYLVYSCTGGASVIASGRNTTASISISANAGDAVLRGYGSAAGTSGLTETTSPFTEQGSAVGASVTTYAGTRDPVASSGSQSFTAPAGNRSIAMVLRQA